MKFHIKPKFNRGGYSQSNRGFTLVELIVVLSILGTLMALFIPSLIAYIDKAEDKNLQYQTRQCVVAAQALVNEQYAKDGTYLNDETDEFKTAVMKLADVPSTDNTVDSFALAPDSTKVIKLAYGSSNVGGKYCTYKVVDDNPTYTIGIREDGGN